MRRTARTCAILFAAILLFHNSADAQLWRSLSDRAARAVAERTEIRNGQAYVKTSWADQNVDLKKLSDRLSWLGVQLPLELSGDVDVDLKLDVPVGSPRTFSLYSFRGSVKSEALEVDSLEIRDLDSAVSLNNGVLSLRRMTFEVTDADDDSRRGKVSGTATAALSPSGNLTATLKLSDVSAESLREFFPVFAGIRDGHLSGEAQVSVPVSQVRSLNAWTITGPVSVQGLDIYDRTLTAGSADAQVINGILQLRKLRGELEGISLSGQADIQLTAPFTYSAQIQTGDFDPSNLQQVFPAPDADPGGSATLTLAADGQFSPFRFNGNGQVHISRTTVAGIHFDELQSAYQATTDRLQFPDATARLFGGAASGAVNIPFSDQSPFKADISWSDIELQMLAESMTGRKPRFAGKSGGRLTVESPALANLMPTQQNDAFLERVTLTVTSRFQGHVISRDGQTGPAADAPTIATDLFLEAALQDQLLKLSKFQVSIGRGALSGVGDISMAGIPEARLALTGNQIDVAQVADVISAFDLSTPVDADDDEPVEFLRARGSVRLTNADVLGIRAESVSFNYLLGRQRLSVSGLSAEIHDGTVTGRASIPLAGTGPLSASLTWNAIDIRRIVQRSDALNGLISGSAQLRIDEVSETFPRGIQEFQREHHWIGITADGLVNFDGAVQLFDDAAAAGVAEPTTASLQSEWQIRDDNISLSRLEARIGDGRIDGSGSLNLTNPGLWTAKLQMSDTDLRVVNALPRDLRPDVRLGGILNLSVDVAGQLDPAEMTGNGSGSLQNLIINDAVIDELELVFEATGRQIDVTRMSTSLYGGTISGSASLPIATDATGRVSVDLNSVDIGALIAGLARVDNTVSGVIDGTIQGTIQPRHNAEHDRNWSATLTTRNAQLLTSPVSDLQASAESRDNIIDYHLSAAVLGGRVAVQGSTAPPESEFLHHGTIEIASVRIEEITRLSPYDASSPEYTGSLNGQVAYIAKPNEFIGRGPMTVRDVTMDGKMLTERASGRVLLANQRLRLDSLQGTVAGAPSTGSVDFNLARPGTGQFEILMSNAPSARFAQWIPQLGNWFSGSANLQLKGHFGSHAEGGGRIYVARGDLKNIRVTNWYIPIRWSIEAGTKKLRVAVRDSRGRLAGGRFTSNGSITFGQRTSVDTSLEFSGVDIESLHLSPSASTQPLRGRASGSLRLAGRSIRSANDLTASLRVTLAGLQSGRIPVVREVREVFSSVVPNSGRYDDGQLDARLLKGGTIRIDRFVLASTDSQLYGTGSISLDGKMDMIFTGSLFTQASGRQPSSVESVLQTSMAGSPCATVAEANRFVSERALRADVHGSFDHPAVQLRPLPILSFENR